MFPNQVFPVHVETIQCLVVHVDDIAVGIIHHHVYHGRVEDGLIAHHTVLNAQMAHPLVGDINPRAENVCGLAKTVATQYTDVNAIVTLYEMVVLVYPGLQCDMGRFLPLVDDISDCLAKDIIVVLAVAAYQFVYMERLL